MYPWSGAEWWGKEKTQNKKEFRTQK
jgi:hypothetical protein